jgi:spore coat protein U-like protein
MLRKKILLAAVGAVTAGLALPAIAGGPSNTSPVSDTFQVLITIQKTCSVTAGSASNINLGTHNSTDTSATGSNSISVTCSKTTPYYIGLQPSSTTATTGAGTMKSVSNSATNTDTVPYQLSSDSAGANIWGNTATSNSVGNGVAGTGAGSASSYTVYATASSLNVTPDNYADTVTVNVNF